MDIERVHVKIKKVQLQAMDIERVHVKIKKVQPEDALSLAVTGRAEILYERININAVCSTNIELF
mgnify:CR=1 FL=1|jgi:hypothetical protein